MKAHCSVCGGVHEFGSMEPTYRLPDAYLDVPEEEREFRTLGDDSWCAVRTADDSERRYFLRAGLPISVFGEPQACHWGVWIEVSEAAWTRVGDLWTDPDQAAEPSFDGRIANALLGYEDTFGLPGTLHLTGPTTVPSFVLDSALTHPLAVEQVTGVPFERRLEWLAWHAHASAA